LEQGNFSFYEKTWKGISQPAKNLISSLLTVDPSKRPSALEVLYTTTIFISIMGIDHVYLRVGMDNA